MINKQTEAELISLLRDLEQIEHIHREVLSKGFNIFEVAGLVRQEIRHSKILAFLLSPNERHGLGDTLLKQLVNEACGVSKHDNKPNSLKMALGDFDDAIVRTEEMHIDILVVSPNNKVVLTIENKVDAGQGLGQLEDYRVKIINDPRFKDYHKLFVYLTLEEDPPADANWWASLKYKFIIESLEDILNRKGSTLNEHAYLFVTHYIDLIRRCVMGEINQELKNACMQVYEKHKQVLKIIFDNIETPITEEVKEFLLSKSDEIQELYSTPKRLAFLTKDLFKIIPENGNDFFGQKRPVAFWFYFQDDKIGLVVEVGPMEDQVMRVNLVNALNEAIGGKSKVAPLSKYTRIWRHHEKAIVDDLESGGVKEIMDRLFNKLQSDGVIKGVREVAERFFS